MKTKIKIILTIIGCLSMIVSADARWYGDHWVNTALTGGWCDEDLQVDATSPVPLQWGTAYGSDTYARYYTQRSAVSQWGNTSWVSCQYWDSTLPNITSVTYVPPATSGWTNNPNFPVTIVGNDYGGSGIKRYYLYYRYQDNPGSTTPGAWSSWIWCGNVGSSFAFTCDGSRGTANRAYQLSAGMEDVAGNYITTNLNGGIIYVDTTPPNANLLINTTALNLLATTSRAFAFTYNDGGAPVSIRSVFEDFASPTTTLSVFAPSGFAYSHTSNENIQNVDLDRGTNGARPYTYSITEICDQAGNCWNGTKDFSYNVYANPNTTGSNIGDTSGLSNAVADGQPRNFVHTIKDGYGNAIIPATGINRTVNMNLSAISNTMYLNQYDRSGGSSVFVDTNITTLQTTVPQALGSRTSTDGSYPLPLFVYTPTANSYVPTAPISDPLASFGFTTNLVVNDTLIGLAANKTFSRTLSNPRFQPLYTSAITGDLRDGGFIEGTAQTSSISIINNSSLIGVSSPELQVVFSGSNSPNFIFSSNPPNSTIGTTRVVLQSGFTSPVSMSSQLVQNAGSTVANLSNLEFSTHFSYILDSKTILYNSDIIGKTGGYWGTVMSGLGNQVGIKIIGPIASNAIRAIVDGQFADGTSIFGGISRADVRNKMRQSIALATRNMQLVTIGSTVDSLTSPSSSSPLNARGAYIDKRSNSSIYKIEKTGGNVTLALASGISGKRTLVVKGANLYITRDMYYMSADSILGVVVQKDEAGNGGNLYIDPGITNIVGTYIIDGSVMSYDGTSEIGVGDITTLKNQLYIYGSIVSENTIGGSRMIPLKCPSLLNVNCTTSAMAQKYDFNYLRRYYLFGGKPFGDGKIIGNETCTVSSCTATSTLPQKFTTPTDPLAQYPVIIEYNPLSRTSPPVGFELSRE